MFSKLMLMLSMLTISEPASAASVVTTKIKSDFIEIKRNDEVVYLNGNVFIEREDLNILADHMKIYYDEGQKDKTKDKAKNKTKQNIDDRHNSIKKIEAQNNIKIFNNEMSATGEKGSYYPDENNFVLEDNVILNRGLSAAKGEKFIYNLKTKKGNLVGQKEEKKKTGDGRITVIIDDSNIKQNKEKNNE